MKKRVGLIGAGGISDWHVRAVRQAGMEVTAVSARTGSTRLQDFAARHNIHRVIEDWRKMLECPEDWDGLLIAAKTFAIPQILEAAMELNVPILVEKPVAMTSDVLARLVQKSHPKILVGYNRRFYDPVRFARDFVREAGPLIGHMSLPESILPGSAPRISTSGASSVGVSDSDPTSAGAASKDGHSYLYPFFENSCHGIDLLRCVFGDLEVKSVCHLKTNSDRIIGFAAILTNARGDVVQLSANWGTPANFGLTLDRPGRRVELKPFEIVTVYEGMEVVGPTDENPIRRYIPKAIKKVQLSDMDHREKPGFVRQAETFRKMLEGADATPDPVAATLKDARDAIKLCEELVGQKCHVDTARAREHAQA